MMTPKPLTKELRAQVLAAIEYYDEAEGAVGKDELDSLLAAEAFWREAVKSLNMMEFHFCPFCHKRTEIAGVELTHTPDCPWRLAQEPE